MENKMSPQIVQLTGKELLEQLTLNSQQQVYLLTEMKRRNDPTQIHVHLRKECNLTSTSRRPQKNKPINNTSSRKHLLAGQKTNKLSQKQLIIEFMQCETKENLEKLILTMRKLSELSSWLVEQFKPAPNFSVPRNQSNDETLSSKLHNHVIKPHIPPSKRDQDSLAKIFLDLELLFQQSEQKATLLDSEDYDPS
jgi:hypothetical protein